VFQNVKSALSISDTTKSRLLSLTNDSALMRVQPIEHGNYGSHENRGNKHPKTEYLCYQLVGAISFVHVSSQDAPSIGESTTSSLAAEEEHFQFRKYVRSQWLLVTFQQGAWPPFL